LILSYAKLLHRLISWLVSWTPEFTALSRWASTAHTEGAVGCVLNFFGAHHWSEIALQVQGKLVSFSAS